MNEIVHFFGYLNETKGGLFYNPKLQTIMVLTQATFLQENYMNKFKP